MKFGNHPIGAEISDAGAVRALELQPYARRKWPIRYDSLEGLAAATDFVAIVLVSVLSGLLYRFHDSGGPIDLSKSVGSGILVSALFISLLKLQGMYGPTELLLFRNQIRAVCLTWISVFLLLAGTVFALKIGSEISRGTSMLFAVFGLTALIVHRIFLKDLLKRGLAERRFSGRNIVLITDHSEGGDADLTQTLSGLGFRVMASFIFPGPDTDVRHHQTVAARIIERIRGSDVEEIMVGADPNRCS
jgi:putative colanic acid biosynthesis UDP-glucose lipid carrier transferase